MTIVLRLTERQRDALFSALVRATDEWQCEIDPDDGDRYRDNLEGGRQARDELRAANEVIAKINQTRSTP